VVKTESRSSHVRVQRVLGDDSRTLNLSGHVGFDSLPDQLVNKCVALGFDMNILCIGETGIGKSTLMDCLFKANFDSTVHTHKSPGVEISEHIYNLKEGNVKLRLAIVDSVGYGDQINKTDSFKPLVDYIDEQFENYLQEELKIKRELVDYHDNRVHVCLYFLAPTGHSIRSLDLVTMKALDKKCNIIPIIAKSDTVSKTELDTFKANIMAELKANEVEIYTFPTDDETVAEVNQEMNEMVPFAVVGSREEILVGDTTVRGREYPWGVVEIENEQHCDFVKLREMLIRTNMEDLREVTHRKHYELYRRGKLKQMGITDDGAHPVSLQETYEQKRAEHLEALQKIEHDMRQMFVNKVKEKDSELKRTEQQLVAKYEGMRKVNNEEKKKLDEEKKKVEEELAVVKKRKEELERQALEAAQNGHKEHKKGKK